jgi:hypothetical protein
MSNVRERELTHEAAAELLAWYASESLPEREAAQVKMHAVDCAECQQEIASLTALKNAVHLTNETLPEPAAAGLDRLLNRVTAYEEAQAKSFLSKLRRLFTMPWSFPQVAFAGQVAIWLLLLGTIILVLQRARNYELLATQERARAEQIEKQLAEARQYTALAGSNQPDLTNSVRLNVVFQENATETDIRALLTTINGTIISGPSPQRFYIVALPVAQDTDRQRILREALERLQSQSQVIFFAAEKTD